jgi:transketolase
MRQTFAKLIYEAMKKDKDLYFLTADLGMYILDDLKRDFPTRFINVGASEQAMMDIAVGLTYADKKVITYTITPFYYRAFETLRTYIDHEKLPVLMVSSGRDNDYEHDGFSHYAGDDGMIISTLKNIEIIKPKTKEELAGIIGRVLKFKQPTYLNLSK